MNRCNPPLLNASTALAAATFGFAALLGAAGCGSEFNADTSDAATADSSPEGAATFDGEAATYDSFPDAEEEDSGSLDDGPGLEDAAPDADRCPIGEAICAPCGGRGVCARACPALACLVDSGARPDGGLPVDAGAKDAGGHADGAPPDASQGDAQVDASACPLGEQECTGCGSPYCAKVCPALVCLSDAAILGKDGSLDSCGSPCGGGSVCCPGGAAGAHTCVFVPPGGVCPLLP